MTILVKDEDVVSMDGCMLTLKDGQILKIMYYEVKTNTWYLYKEDEKKCI